MWVSQRGLHAGLGWQVTPVLYSFAVRDEVPPFRFFAVDPLARQGGAIEVALSAENVFAPPRPGQDWVLRAGARVYAPLAARGESLSVSAGASIYTYGDRLEAAYELGVYTLFGVVGLVLRVAPADERLPASAMLRIRYL